MSISSSHKPDTLALIANNYMLMAQPKTLFEAALKFVSTNVEAIENLNDFPEIIGEKIFERFIVLSNLVPLSSERQAKIIHVFATAYKEIVLKSINLSESLIVINEFFESFVELFRFVTELCLCSCYLGDNHELFEDLQNFTSLRKLCLRNNCLKDEAIRKITLPIRMFNKGAKDIEFLDLSDNKFTDSMTSWLSVFGKLQSLEISESNLTKKGIQIIEKKCSLKLSESESNIHPIITKGWATLLVQKWKDSCTLRRENRKFKKHRSYFSEKRYEAAEEILSASRRRVQMPSKKLVFKRTFHIELDQGKMISTSSNNTFSSSILYKDAIEDDLFQQYC